ncbi:MAG: PIN domain-containing protein [Planctomycetes bacterium]|nr:PIN domain-containing protein [Planctomycetota bacterium]
MIAVDTNILIYAHKSEMPLHGKALRRLAELSEGSDPWGIPVFCLAEFLRVVTHPAIFDRPSTVEHATAKLGELLRSPRLILLVPGARFWPLLAEVAREADARGNLIYDAQIVAVCRENGVRDILTQDRDLARFSGVRIQSL